MLRHRVYLLDAGIALILALVTRAYQTDGSVLPGPGPIISAFVPDLGVWWPWGALIVIGLLVQHRWPLAGPTLYALGDAARSRRGLVLLHQRRAEDLRREQTQRTDAKRGARGGVRTRPDRPRGA